MPNASTASTQGPVAVGVESTDAGRLAVAWAADEAMLRRRPLRLVRAVDWPFVADEAPSARTLSWQTPHERFRNANQHVLDEARAAVLARHPGLEVDERLTDGPPKRVLSASAEDASMIVLGSRRMSSLQEAFTTGSIAVPVIAHASCPVAVVRYGEPAELASSTVVVGVDGSRSADLALGCAFEEASLRRASVLAVSACPPLLGLDAAALVTDTAVRDARETVERSIDAWRVRHPGVPAVGEVRLGHPVHLLTEASKNALLLVVGTRGLGGFRRMLLGSVSYGLVHHTRCPLIVVPGPADDE
ncbi:MAG TPA: universal stress protein [Yinghuangia sp.]|uniref:universal stress protein n=1 Tax=Yinghuangia sp. YIM S10712 TaxID=3436930 RepID=UPI002C28C1D4|nr:universal stress protein [Yinghuangia sp.]